VNVCGVSWLDLLHELCLQNGYVLLLTANHHDASFAAKAYTELKHLDVVEPLPGRLRSRVGMRRRLVSGDLILRCELKTLDHDLEAAAELLVGLLERTKKRAA